MVEEKQDFNVMSDIEELNKNIKENEISKIVELICKRSNSERQKIKEMYFNQWDIELEKELDSKLSGDVHDLIKGLMMTPEDFDASQLRTSMKGLGTDESLLSEILATRPSRHLLLVKDRYSILYNEKLEEDIKGDTSKFYEKILCEVIKGERSDNPYPNSQKMKDFVKNLKDEEKGKILEDKLVECFGNCSYGEICTICRLYEKTYKEAFLDAIKQSVDSDGYDFCKIFLQYISDSGSFFAEKLHNFKEKDLNRILISRSEIDMDEIRYAYKDLYKTDLIDDIKENTKDDYQLGLTILAQK